MIETATHIVGVESKRYEPYRTKVAGSFSDAYWRDVWGTDMGPFEAVRDGLRDGSLAFERLDAVRLVKHAFGLRTETGRRGKRAMLVYIYAEPETWPDGRAVSGRHRSLHGSELQRFCELVVGAEVAFRSCDYGTLLQAMSRSDMPAVRSHAEAVQATFNP